MIITSATAKPLTDYAALRDKEAGLPTPGYDPARGHHVCPACRARVDRPTWQCASCGWGPSKGALPSCVGTLDHVREVVDKDGKITAYETEGGETATRIDSAQAKPDAQRTADEKVLAAVSTKAVAAEPKPDPEPMMSEVVR